MFYKVIIFLSVLVCPIISLGACKPEEQIIRNYLDQNQPPEFGQGLVVAKHRGNLRGTIEAIAVIYSYQISNTGDRFGEYLVLFEPHDNRCQASIPVQVGLRGIQTFSKIEVKDNKIILAGLRWAPSDAMCCPSKEVMITFSYNGEGMPIPLADGT